MLVDIILWGLVVGIAHFVVVGALYQNPAVAKMYNACQGEPGVKSWASKKAYVSWMFAGTQVEVFILTGAYLFLRDFFPEQSGTSTAWILGGLFAAIRVYPRFWTMWIQTSYPNRLLAIEFVNGTIGTFVIVLCLSLLPI